MGYIFSIYAYFCLCPKSVIITTLMATFQGVSVIVMLPPISLRVSSSRKEFAPIGANSFLLG